MGTPSKFNATQSNKDLRSPKSILKSSSNQLDTLRTQRKLEKLKQQASKKLDREQVDDYDYETGTFGWEREQGIANFNETYEFVYDCVPSEEEYYASESESEEEQTVETDKYGFRIKPKKDRGKLVDEEFEEHYQRKEEMDLIK